MLLQQETEQDAGEDAHRSIDGVPLLESQPIDFSRAGGGLPVPVDMETEAVGRANLDGDPLEVLLIKLSNYIIANCTRKRTWMGYC